jgi:hypothetical protein
MKIFWYIIYMTSAFFIIFVLPFALFYYESDEDQTFVINKEFMIIESEIMHCIQIRDHAGNSCFNRFVWFLCRLTVCLIASSCPELCIRRHCNRFKKSRGGCFIKYIDKLVYLFIRTIEYHSERPDLCDCTRQLDRMVVANSILGGRTFSTTC